MAGVLDCVVLFLNKYKDLLPWITSLVTIIASFVAIRGINAWRTQLIGTSQHKVAIQFLRALLMHRKLLLQLCDPIYKLNELDELDELPENSITNLTDIEDHETWIKEWQSNNRKIDYYTKQSVFKYRVENLNKNRIKLEELELELEVFGIIGIRESMKEIDQLSYYLYFSINMEIQKKFNTIFPNKLINHEELANDTIKTFIESGGKYYSYPETPESRKEFENDLNVKVNILERIVRKIV